MSGKRRAAGPPVKKTASKASQRPRTRKQKIWRVAKWLLIAGLAGLLVVTAGLVYLYKTTEIPKPNEAFETQTSFVYYSDGKDELGDFATQNRVSISYDQMPQTIKDAVVAAENRSFWTDKGIDPKGIIRAAFSNASGNATQGASTITQQYVKILYLNQERSYQRKIKEAILSLKLQRTQSKKQILEGYLNTIYFGRGAYGIQAAAQAYFDKDAKDLSLRESAVLASVLNNPTHFDPDNGNRKDLKQRYAYVLNGMADAGNVPAAKAEKAAKHLPKFPKIAVESKLAGQKGHMLTMVRSELHSLGFDDEQIDGGGLRITTTFTRKAMDAAAAGVREVRPDMGKDNKNLHAAVASVEPGTGAVRGFYAGQDYLQSQINWAVTGGAPGSTFKAFAVAAALKDGFALDSTFDGNSPYYYNGQGTGDRVRNEGSGSDGLGTDYGDKVSLLRATEESINTAFADLTMAMENGPQKILDTAEALGIPAWNKGKKGYNNIDNSPGLEPISGIALGSATIAPVNMANAYAAIANGGRSAPVHVIDKVTTKDGEVLYTFKQHTDQAISEDVAADTSYALQQVVQSGTGTGAQALGRPAAGKTGTATNGNDEVSSSWFVGYTPQLATAVMYVRGQGNEQLDGWLPDYNGLAGYFGANYPTRTWTAVMQKDMEGVDEVPFPERADLQAETEVEGHDPYTPPPPKPTKTKTEKPTESPTPSETPSETPTTAPPSETPTPSCGLLGCDSPSGSPTTSESPSGPASSAAAGRVSERRVRRRTGARRG